MEISKILTHHATFRPDHSAFVFEHKRWTFKELNWEVNKMANAMHRLGIRKGDRVASLLPNCAALWEMYWACAKTGAISVPLSPLLRGEGLINILNNADVSLILTTQSFLSYIEEISLSLSKPSNYTIWVVDGESKRPGVYLLDDEKMQSSAIEVQEADILSEDLYNIIYSSGTTGQPKGIMISHFTRAMYMSLFANAFRIAPESRVMHSGSIIFNGAFLTLMPAMYQGCTYILMKHFDPDEVYETLKNEKITHTILVPSQIIQMLECTDFNRKNLPDLEMILTVGAPLDTSYKLELNKRIPGVFYELYGLTEGFVTILDKTELHDRIASVGKPPFFSEMKIVDNKGEEMPNGEVGEIVGKGPFMMSGYYRDEKKTSEAIIDGWLYTGDLGFSDDQGYLFLAGRKKDLIISGGVNVYPRDIEEVVLQRKDVLEVVVFGIPDAKWGETPVAAIIPRMPKPDPQELIQWINERLHSRYQKLKDVLFMDSFPRNVAGKILKRELTAIYLEKNK